MKKYRPSDTVSKIEIKQQLVGIKTKKEQIHPFFLNNLKIKKSNELMATTDNFKPRPKRMTSIKRMFFLDIYQSR
jgi:hypothetical protein